jgi:hypothetical protein
MFFFHCGNNIPKVNDLGCHTEWFVDGDIMQVDSRINIDFLTFYDEETAMLPRELPTLPIPPPKTMQSSYPHCSLTNLQTLSKLMSPTN